MPILIEKTLLLPLKAKDIICTTILDGTTCNLQLFISTKTLLMLLSNIQSHRTSSTITTATVVILAIIAVAALFQLHVIPLVLSIPLFLIPVSIYTTVIGLNKKKEFHITQDYSYYFTWAGIMLAIGIGLVVIYENMGIVIGVISVLSIALGYVYLNKIKSAMFKTN